MVAFPVEKCVEALDTPKAEFCVRFRELHVYAKEIRLFQNPFTANIDKAQPSYRMKVTKTPVRSRLKDKDHCLRLAVTRMEPHIQLYTSQMQACSDHQFG